MKKLTMVLLLISMAISASAQWYYKMYGVTTMDSLTEAQLNLGLQKSLSTAKTGKIMTVVGAGMIVGGYALALSSFNADDWESGVSQGLTGGMLFYGGVIVGGIGVGHWIVGSSRKKDIQIVLVKFEGSASINGVGITVYF
jgi:hypothetical protein